MTAVKIKICYGIQHGRQMSTSLQDVVHIFSSPKLREYYVFGRSKKYDVQFAHPSDGFIQELYFKYLKMLYPQNYR